jgi:two-component system sensor histidine kinase BaeS
MVNRLRLSIALRLFLAMALSGATIAVLGGGLVRWKLSADTSAGSSRPPPEPVEALSASLSARYREHHDWSFLPVDGALRKAWLRDALVDADASPGGRRTRASLEHRIGLLDRDRRVIAGVIASPWMVAFASIDQSETKLVIDGTSAGSLVIARPQSPDDALAVAFLLDQQTNLMVVTAAFLLASALAAAALAAGFRQPILELVRGARRLEGAHYDTRLRVRRRDELGELAEAFNHLAARLEGAERARRNWVADTSHELRTPLSVLRGQMEALQDGVRAPSPDSIALMLRHVQSLTSLVDDLHELARAEVGAVQYEKARVDVWPIVRELFTSFAPRFEAAGLQATIGAPPASSRVDCDARRVRQLALNLLENCVRYTAAGGRIEVSGACVDGELLVTIDDSAPGLTGAELARLGERFFRTDAARARQLGGAGLGLALSKQIAEAHGGALRFSASPLGGLRATLVLKVES